jgi:hypothetical protein
LELVVKRFEIRYSAAAMKSSNTFCFRSCVPPLCHSTRFQREGAIRMDDWELAKRSVGNGIRREISHLLRTRLHLWDLEWQELHWIVEAKEHVKQRNL